MPVLRVDDEVWEWLKKQARPLEDTPNSVLRRVAAIDPPLGAPAHDVATALPAHDAAAGSPTDRENGVSRPSTLAVTPRLAKRLTGEGLNRAFRIGARHALYHKDGTFFERLVRFPGILCDSGGFVRFEDEEQFLGDQRLSIGEKVNVPRALSSHPRHTPFPSRLA